MTVSKDYLIDCKGYSLRVEYTPNEAILHMPKCDKFNKSVYLDLTVTVYEILDLLYGLGYNCLWAAIEPNNTKTQKLAKKIGFEYVQDAQGLKVYRLV